MKRNEFRILIEERDSLYKGLAKADIIKHEIYVKRIREIDKLLNFEMPEKYGNYFYLSYKFIEEMFTIGFDKIMLMLESYFKNMEDVKIYTDLKWWGDEISGSSGKFLMISTPRKAYNLGELRHNESLRVLYNADCYGLKENGFTGYEKNEGTWGTLVQKYPDLIDYMWEQFFELKNQSKKEKIGLIGKMIARNNEEQEILKNPQLRENRISELEQQNNDLGTELSKLTDSLEEVEI